ncbi:hypothetical protein EUTSA_v10022355mg [Eutrema salsugineum]|uniref:F-box domain-containing protein n=2 Tax=Eutrema salsugineum TaxID=72664 RepID=V4LYC0_EUTSA|nr:hypothetical protein EUTSA_v10022355mg [Eutrema salsugineum]
MLVPSLPDDFLSCFARVSRLYYPTLSLVSKHFRSLLASPELYKARSLLGHEESCLYLCLGSQYDSHWFTLCRKPDQTLINNGTSLKKKSSGYVLARVPILHSPPAYFPSLVAVGSDIYNIGSRSIINNSSVSVMDCRSHTWHEAPSMPVELISLSASVVDGKIYVSGRGSDDKNSLEVLDTKTKTWDHVPISCNETRCSFYYSRSACIDGKFHVAADGRFYVVAAGEKLVSYNSREGRLDQVELRMCDKLFSDTYCEIENVLYSAGEGAIRWFDTKVQKWRYLMVFEGLPKFPPAVSVRLADYGGKMAVFWEEYLLSSEQKMIWCAVVMLKRHKFWEIWGESCEIWGIVEWFDHVLTVPIGYQFVKALAATV